MSELIECNPRPEYVYTTIPAEYVCVYHKILELLADYGEDMLKDCKASCTDKNSNVIDCYNMFNAAVAARSIGKEKLAETLIYYIKAKLNQIYKGKDGNIGYVFPIDDKGKIKAFVSCNDRPKFYINADNGALYVESRKLGTPEHFILDTKDKPFSKVLPNIDYNRNKRSPLDCVITTDYTNNKLTISLEFYYKGQKLPEGAVYDIDYYIDKQFVEDVDNITNLELGKHLISIVAQYEDDMMVKSEIFVI